MEQLSIGDGVGLNVLPNGDVVNENGDFIKKDGVYLDSPTFNNEIIPMEQIDQSFYNGSFITEEEANDEIFIKSMEAQFKSEPEVDDFDVSGNKEPTLGENIAEFGSNVKNKLNENEAFVDSVKKDTAIGMIQGADAGLKNTLYAPGDILGAGVDFVNDKIVKPVLNEFGIEGSDRPFGGTEMNTDAMDKITSFINDITPNFLKEPINEFADQPFTFETYGNLVKGFSQFGIVAIPAAQIVGYMSSANSLVRAVAWSGIADFTAMNPDDPGIPNILLDYFKVNQDKLQPWATNAIAVLEKHDTDGVLTKRLKNMQEGVIVGAFADTVVLPLIKGILKASVNIPWKGLTPLIAGTAGATFSNDAEGSLFGAAVKAGIKEAPSVVKKKVLNNLLNLTRAKKLGFDVDNPVYHGTNASELTEFKESTIGSATDKGFYGKGFYFASNQGEAGFYGKNVGKYVVRGKLLDLNNKTGDYTLGGTVKFVDWAEKLDKIGMLDKVTKDGLIAAKKMHKYLDENIEYKIGQNPDGTDGVFASIVDPTRKVDIYKGKEYPHTINVMTDYRRFFPKTKEEAKENLLHQFVYAMSNQYDNNGYTKANDFFKGWNDDILLSLSDYIRVGGKGSEELTKKARAAGFDGIKADDETVIFDPKNIRSIDAKFDPSKTNSPDLMSSYLKQNNSQMT